MGAGTGQARTAACISVSMIWLMTRKFSIVRLICSINHPVEVMEIVPLRSLSEVNDDACHRANAVEIVGLGLKAQTHPAIAVDPLIPR